MSNKTNNLKAYLRDLYEGIVSKKPDASRNPQNFRSEIEAIRTGGELYEVMDASELPEDAPNGSLALVEGEPMGDGVLVCNDETVTAQTAIKEVICPNATRIGNSAFRNCTSLTSIDLPSATSIDAYAFENCTSLTSIDLPNATNIRLAAFRYCPSLISIHLPTVVSLGSEAFKFCTALTSVDLPMAQFIDEYAFQNCESLTSVNLPKAERIEGAAFNICTELNTLILGNTETVCDLNVGAIFDTKILTAEGMPTGEGFVYVPTALYEQYVANLVAQVMAGGYDEATATYLVTSVLRKIEDYPEICGEVA